MEPTTPRDPEDWDLDLAAIVRAWAQRPFAHLVTVGLAGSPLLYTLRLVMRTGISDLCMVLGTLIAGMVLGLAVVLLLEGPWKTIPVRWSDETLSAFTLVVPPRARALAQGMSQAGATVLMGWELALVTGTAVGWLGGDIGAVKALTTLMYGSMVCMVFGLWLTTLVPSFLTGMMYLPSRLRSKVVVVVEGASLKAGRQSFALGRKGQHFELGDHELGGVLHLRNDEQHVKIAGSREHLMALVTRLEAFEPDRGSSVEVPEALAPIRHRAGAPDNA